jgi:imidazole glycerol phosphate synthase glutamine amidotransferase subunit
VTALVSYGGGNLRSLRNALLQLGVASRAVATPGGLEQAERIILPGVGHFGAMMRALDARGLRAPLCRRIRAGVPFLGICLGFQALFDSSAEAPGERGLGIVAGHVGGLSSAPRLPHMGWNHIAPLTPARLLAGIPAPLSFYFAHSYAMPAGSASAALCHYGSDFTAVFEAGNCAGVQFHPEKSGSAGLRLLANFLEWKATC